MSINNYPKGGIVSSGLPPGTFLEQAELNRLHTEMMRNRPIVMSDNNLQETKMMNDHTSIMLGDDTMHLRFNFGEVRMPICNVHDLEAAFEVAKTMLKAQEELTAKAKIKKQL